MAAVQIGRFRSAAPKHKTAPFGPSMRRRGKDAVEAVQPDPSAVPVNLLVAFAVTPCSLLGVWGASPGAEPTGGLRRAVEVPGVDWVLPGSICLTVAVFGKLASGPCDPRFRP